MLVGVADTSGIAVSAYGLKPLELLEAKQSGRKMSELDEGMACTSDSYVWRFKSAGANVIIEALPSNLDEGLPAYEIIEHAMAERMHVVTANKGAMLRGLRRLETAAKEESVGFGYSATTGGALPSVSFGVRELAGARVEEISGILNTTTNFILSSMEEGRSYEEALAEAQRLGIAEPNPSQDVDGLDTAAKLVIISNKLMDADSRLADVSIEGITNLEDRLDIPSIKNTGGSVKLIGRATRTDEGIKLKVGPEAVFPGNPFFTIKGASKAVTYRSDTLGEFTIIEHESSRLTTAAAMYKDMIHIAQEHF